MSMIENGVNPEALAVSLTVFILEICGRCGVEAAKGGGDEKNGNEHCGLIGGRLLLRS